jgi:tyrosyl-tRNA synthetase
MDVQTRISIIRRSPTCEVVTDEDLRSLLQAKARPVHYVGLEISGLLHVGSVFMLGYKLRDFLEAGCTAQVYLADWHSVINNKFGGDWEKISRASKYYEEAFKFFAPGVKIVRGSELYHNNDDYWRNVVTFCKHVTLARDVRCLEIMGRSQKETLDVAKYVYPPMQAVDIRAIGADIAHAGMDQRKIHMLAREVYPAMGFKKPVAVHHSLLPGLLEPERAQAGEGQTEKEARVAAAKMSKSKPDTSIFLNDDAETIKRKLSKAYCPAEAEGNPVLALARHIVFREQKEFSVIRPAKFGGDVSFSSYEEVEKAYLERKLHAADLKAAVAEAVDRAVAPIRSHFERRKDLLEVFGQAKVTR